MDAGCKNIKYNTAVLLNNLDNLPNCLIFFHPVPSFIPSENLPLPVYYISPSLKEQVLSGEDFNIFCQKGLPYVK